MLNKGVTAIRPEAARSLYTASIGLYLELQTGVLHYFIQQTLPILAS